MTRDKGQSEKLEIIRRTLLEDSKNREKYLKIRSEKGLINENSAKERYLFNEQSITINKEGEIMTEKPNTVVVNEEIAAEKTLKPKEKKLVLSDAQKAKEKERLAKEKEKAKEKERLAKEKEKAKEKERLAKEKEKAKEKERLAKEKEKAKEKERLAKEKEKAKEKERLAKEKERLNNKKEQQQEKIKTEKLAKQKEEQERIEAEKLAKQKEEQERIEAEKLAKQKEEQERIEAEKLAKQKEEQERIKAEKLAKQKEEQERIEAEKLAKEIEEQERIEAEKLAKETEEKEKTEAEKLAKEKEEEEKQKTLDIQERMRRKMEAQKLLDQGFMKSDAEKTQSKEINLKEKLSKLEEDFQESYDDKLDKELEEAYEKIDSLENDNKKILDKIVEAEKKINKLSKQISTITQEKTNEHKLNQDLEKKILIISKEKDDLVAKLENVNKEFTEQKDEFKKTNLLIEEIRQELVKKEKELAFTEQKDDQFKQREEELISHKSAYEASIVKITELEKENQELIQNIEQLKEENIQKLEQKESEIAIQKKSDDEILKRVAELEQSNQQLLEQKIKLQESLNDVKQKKATLLSIKYDDIFVLDKSGEDVSAELKNYLEKIKQEKEDIFTELNNKNAELIAKDELIVILEKENTELKVMTQEKEEIKPTLFEENEVEVKEIYNVEAEIKKIKDEISQIKQREISTLESSEQQYIINKNQDIYQRIHNLEQEIYQKDQQLQMIRQQFSDISEEKIIDPEFKRKIRRARDMKKELNESFEEEKKYINRSIIQVEQQINQKKIEVANAKEKVETIEKEYAGQTDRTSLGRESYLSKRGKALIELELFEDRLQKLEGELVDLKGRYDYLVQCYDERIGQLNQSEKEIIDYYLNEMKSDLIDRDKTYNVKNEEKEELIRQLNELNQAQQQTQTALWQNNQVISKALETNREIKEQFLNDKRQNIDRTIRRLENELQEKNTEHNNYISLLNMVNLKYGERTEAEKRIRTTDELVANYLKITDDIDELTQDYHDNLIQTQEVTEKIDALVGNPDEKSEVLRLKAKLEDLDILKTDLIAKIEFLRKKSDQVINNEKVLYYAKLSESIKELKNKQEELKVSIEKCKSEIAEKNADLEKVKEEKLQLE